MAISARNGIGPWIVVALLSAAVLVLGIVLVAGAGTADEAGRPLGVPAIAVTPGPTPIPTPSSTADDSPHVVDGLPPVTVDLDDHGGADDHGGSDNSGTDNSGKGSGSDD